VIVEEEVHIWNITFEGVSPCDDLVNKTNSFFSHNSCQISRQERKKETLGISHFLCMQLEFKSNNKKLI